jgi:membrane-bound ClpP family serine protease
MIGEIGIVKSPIGTNSEGWVFVHGERWRAVLAFAPGEAEIGENEPVLEMGRKVTVVGFRDDAVAVVPVDWPGRRPVLNPGD